MATYKLTALADVEVTAQVGYQGSIPLPRNHQGESQGKMPIRRNKEETIRLKKGESREYDIDFLHNINEPNQMPDYKTLPLPTAVGERVQQKQLLLIERIS